MSYITYKEISNLSVEEASSGKTIAFIPGQGGIGPSSAVVFVTATYPIGTPTSIQLFPGGRIATDDTGVGEVGVTTTYVNSGDDQIFNMTWDGNTDVGEPGYWQGEIRIVFAGPPTALISIVIQAATYDLSDDADFDDNIFDDVRDVILVDPEYDSETEEGEVEIQFSYDNDLAENPTGFVIQRQHISGPDGSGPGDGLTEGDPPQTIIVGSIPWVDGTISYNFVDHIFAPGEYEWLIYAYKYGGPPNSLSPPSIPVSVVFGEESPDINITGSGGMDLGGAADLVFISNASGIYTLVPNKREDTLYDRVLDTTIDVKIPDPFIKTGYIGG